MLARLDSQSHDNLIQAILAHLSHQPRDEWGRGPRRGLAALGLACVSWALAIRSALFAHLVVQNEEDVAQLQAFLAGPAVRGRSLADFMSMVTLLHREDISRTPWTLEPASGLQLHLPPSATVRVIWGIWGDSQPSHRDAFSALSIKMSARLRRSITHVHELIVSEMHDVEVHDMVNLTQCLRLGKLELRDMTFVGWPEPSHLPPPYTPPPGSQQDAPPTEFNFTVSGCVKATNIKFWVRLHHLVLVRQRIPADDADVFVLPHLELATRLHPCQHSELSLNVKYSDHKALHAHGKGRAAPCVHRDLTYNLSQHSSSHETPLVQIIVPASQSAAPQFRFVAYTCPDAAGDALAAAVDRLFDGLADLGATPPCHLSLDCGTVELARALLHCVLEGRVRTHGDARVELGLYSTSLTLDDIRATPTMLELGNGTSVPLTTEQRAGLVMCGDWEEPQEAYLEALRQAALLSHAG